MTEKSLPRLLILTILLIGYQTHSFAQKSEFNVIAFYTARQDAAHISFVHEANQWFKEMSVENHFTYDSTNNWQNLNKDFLANYQVVLFLDTRPELPAQRKAFQLYMENGGGWMGFHFSAFALTPSTYPQNWDWYHQDFLGSGEYLSNTWRPTSATLLIEAPDNPVTKDIPTKFESSPNEWYRWENDLRKNSDIKILVSIDTSSFPLGTGPKPSEIWHEGYYPVVWTNRIFPMVYFNMGHNDMDYENGTNKTLSHTFGNPVQDKLIMNALLWLGHESSVNHK